MAVSTFKVHSSTTHIVPLAYIARMHLCLKAIVALIQHQMCQVVCKHLDDQVLFAKQLPAAEDNLLHWTRPVLIT